MVRIRLLVALAIALLLIGTTVFIVEKRRSEDCGLEPRSACPIVKKFFSQPGLSNHDLQQP